MGVASSPKKFLHVITLHFCSPFSKILATPWPLWLVCNVIHRILYRFWCIGRGWLARLCQISICRNNVVGFLVEGRKCLCIILGYWIDQLMYSCEPCPQLETLNYLLWSVSKVDTSTFLCNPVNLFGVCESWYTRLVFCCLFSVCSKWYKINGAIPWYIFMLKD